jgi:excisionase family DNA binding protein
MAEKTYTTFEVSRICGVYPTTVINWVKQQKLPAFVTPGGHRRIKRDDLVVFLKKYNFPTPVELSASRRRIMVVDDDVSFARMIEKAFEKYRSEFEVVVINSGIEALIALGKRAPDLVILDVVMPVVDGATVCATLKANPETRHVRILAITGKKLADRQLKFLRSNADGLMVKPFDVEAMVKKAADILRVDLPVPA